MKQFLQVKTNTFLTPEAAVLRPHRDVNAVVLGSTLCQRLLQGLCVQHETIVEAAGDVVHLQEESRNFEQPATMGICAIHTVMIKDLNDGIKKMT